jgi:NAD-dependent dihydropyrimidine dehydrogenase PreA subunit
MKREIVTIDNDKCNGCGVCIPNCHEGALQIIDNKAVLISELMCDGLGACLGHCPEGALKIESREAEPYDEIKVMKEMVSKGKNVVIAHLTHLKEHKEFAFLKQGVRYLWDNKASLNFDPAEVVEIVHGLPPIHEGFKVARHTQAQGHACPGSKADQIERTDQRMGISSPANIKRTETHGSSCPGSNAVQIDRADPGHTSTSGIDQKSELSQWPVQLHLINPAAAYFEGSDLLLSADCVAYTVGNFHSRYLKNKKLIIACPKLDKGLEIYVDKIRRLMTESKVNTITVMRMEVPCCGGLISMVKEASKNSGRKVPVKDLVISITGELLSEEWI